MAVGFLVCLVPHLLTFGACMRQPRRDKEEADVAASMSLDAAGTTRRVLVVIQFKEKECQKGPFLDRYNDPYKVSPLTQAECRDQGFKYARPPSGSFYPGSYRNISSADYPVGCSVQVQFRGETTGRVVFNSHPVGKSRADWALACNKEPEPRR